MDSNLDIWEKTETLTIGTPGAIVIVGANLNIYTIFDLNIPIYTQFPPGLAGAVAPATPHVNPPLDIV